MNDIYSKAEMTVIAIALTVIAGNQLFGPAQARAEDFDGWCFPSTACTEVPMPIGNSTFNTCEETCTMKNPVNVNDMDATLYYVECKGDWGSHPIQRMLFMRYIDHDNRSRAVVLDNDGVTELERCR